MGALDGHVTAAADAETTRQLALSVLQRVRDGERYAVGMGRVMVNLRDEDLEELARAMRRLDATGLKPDGQAEFEATVRGRELTRAAQEVIAERARHTEFEGYTPEHDAGLIGGDLCQMSSAYANAAGFILAEAPEGDHFTADDPPEVWPPEYEFKPASARRMLVKSAALALAAIEDFDRRQEEEGRTNGSEQTSQSA